MAWEDRTPFEAILCEYGLNEAAVIRLMRQNMKASSLKCGVNASPAEKPNICNCVHPT